MALSSSSEGVSSDLSRAWLSDPGSNLASSEPRETQDQTRTFYRKAINMASQSLTAAYVSPAGEEHFKSSLPNIHSEDVKEKTAYLSALRSSTTQLQSDINTFLTKKMEDDKASGDRKVDEKAEEMYGEEDADEDA